MATLFLTAVKAVGDVATWVTQETDELFAEVAVIGMAVESAADEAVDATKEAFLKDNMKVTAKLLAEGALDFAVGLSISRVVLHPLPSCAKLLFDPVGILAGAAQVTVRELSKRGKGMVNEAQELFDDAKKFSMTLPP